MGGNHPKGNFPSPEFQSVSNRHDTLAEQPISNIEFTCERFIALFSTGFIR
jgi:hypothetical protein